MIALETFGLTKYYQRGRVKALEDFTLQVERGKIFSLLGPNGAGKTTLIKVLLGIVFPTRGSARLLGEDISHHRIRQQVGYLAENHRFPDFLTAEMVLYYYGKMAGVSKTELRERIPRLLELVKLQDWAGTKIRKFSKGMLQRLGVAQALINDPELLFLDEPTDGIDPVGRREIRDLLQELRDRGKTIFLNSHLLSEVERLSDEIAILKNGQLLEKGNVQDFIAIRNQYLLRLQDGRLPLQEICRRLEIPLRTQAQDYLVAVEDEQQLNALIDELRRNQTLIQAVIPRKITLEDFFIEVIQEKQETKS